MRVLILTFFAICGVAHASDSLAIALETQKKNDLQATAFEMLRAGEVKLKTIGKSELARSENGGLLGENLFFAWILNSKTRELVWRSTDQFYPALMAPYKIDTRLHLKPGVYELYLIGALVPIQYTRDRQRMEKEPGKDLAKISPKVVLTGSQAVVQERTLKESVERLAKKSIVSLTRLGDSANAVAFFDVKATSKFRLYMVGEGDRRVNSLYDYAYIDNLTTQKRVWSCNLRKAHEAGGARKNIKVRERITLPPGRYAVYYDSDDSHSFNSWNDWPPYDPFFWGITLWADSKNDLKNISIPNAQPVVKPLVDMTRIRNNEHRTQGLEVLEDVNVRLTALGEGTRWVGFGDFGWIESLATQEVVWKMTMEHSQHAGGADKNRVESAILSLKPGRYVIHYKSDDSHAFASWNQDKPSKGEHWGLRLWPVTETDRSKMRLMDVKIKETMRVLAQLVNPNGNDYLEERFTLPQATRVKIFAVGEKDGKELLDFGWIENDETGRIIWDMRQENCQPIGGRNVFSQSSMTLPKGTYTLLYETNDTHHPGDWKGKAPVNKQAYGITIVMAF